MDIFDTLRDKIAKAQIISASLALNTPFPPEKRGSGLFTAEEAAVIIHEFINILAVATEDKDKFIRHIGAHEIKVMSNAINIMLAVGESKDFDNFVVHVENMIPSIRAVNESFKKSADNRRYRQIVNMEKTLSEINQQKHEVSKISRMINSKATKIEEVHNIASNKITKLEEHNTQSQTLLDGFKDHLKNAQQHEETIKNLLEQSNSHLIPINEAVTLAQQQKEAIASRDTEANEYRGKIDDFITRHETAINDHQKENEEGIKEIRELSKKAESLITKSETALQIGGGAGLSGVFIARRDRAARSGPKCFWIALLLLFSGGAIWLGYETITTQSDISGPFVFARTLILFIAMAVAGFAAKQYAKNKTIEEDYSYKSALAGSFPVFIKELNNGTSNYCDIYVEKLLNELLQDPQRDRSQDNVKPINNSQGTTANDSPGTTANDSQGATANDSPETTANNSQGATANDSPETTERERTDN